jgi:hypothetical protein
MDALLDQDYAGLIISGHPTDAQLREAWGKIYLQYCELSDTANSPIVEKIKQVQYLAARVTLGQCIAVYLGQTYDDEVVAMLKQLGIPVQVEPGDDRTAKAKQIMAYLKRWATDKDVAQRELDEMQATEGGKIGRVYFDDWLDAISQQRRYTVLARDITVAQFLRATRRMREDYEKNKKN